LYASPSFFLFSSSIRHTRSKRDWSSDVCSPDLDHVFFLGFQNNPYIYMKQADLFVLTSIHEGFSHVVAEALATGVPVVSTDCKSGPREVLDNGQYGKLCTVGDAENIAENMLEVLSYGEDKRQQVIQAGYERADFFNAQRIVKEYEQTFLDTLADKG